jgi:transcriptional regulator with XRE-family HTH domain
MEKPEFGRRLIEVRKAKGLTQEEVAEGCKITTRTIQRIESGMVKPRAFTIKLISESLGFDFYDNSDAGYDIIMNQNSDLKKHTTFWYAKDLFNLKTNAMKKISILSLSTLTIALSLFALTSNVFAQTSGKKKNSISIEKNPDKSIKRIEVRFTNELTYDSLVFIKNALEKHDIKINYKIIEFNDNNRLKAISCEAFTEMGSGSFYVSQLDSSSVGGFYRDYSKNAKIPFCIGSGCFKPRE